MEGNRNEGQKK